MNGGIKGDLKGYYKNLLTISKDTTGEGFTGDLNRLRLDLTVSFRVGLTLNGVLDNEVIAGSVLDAVDFRAAKEVPDPQYFDLSKELADERDLFWRAGLYRLNAVYRKGPFTLTAGRQRVSLGAAIIWNPEDLLNPISPLAVERDERQGVDALTIEYSTGALASISAAYSPGRDPSGDSFFARAKANVSGYDLSLMAGNFRRDKVAGFDLSGYIGDSSLRGELTYTVPDDGSAFVRAAAGIDHTFQSSLYVLVEYLYNGGNAPGLTDPLSVLTSPEIITRNRDFLGVAVGYDITPLLRFDSLVVTDIEGGGALVSPSFSYNILEGLDVAAGLQLFPGKNNSEYGDLPALYYASAKLFF